MDINHDMEAMQNRMRPELGEHLIEKRSINDEECFNEKRSGRESIAYVFISTLVVVVGSYAYGSCVSLVLYFLVLQTSEFKLSFFFLDISNAS